MAGEYEVWLTNDKGVRMELLDDILSFAAPRVTNGIAHFEGTFLHDFDESLIKRDFMVQVWRKPSGGAMSLWRPYFVRRWRWFTRGSKEGLAIFGPCCNDLLRRRIVAAYAGSSQASKTDNADDMMKEIVTEAIADGVAPTPDAGTRVWTDLSVAADLGDGPSLTKAFVFDRLLTTSGAGILLAIAKAAKEAGTEVFFDIVPDVVTSNSITFQFRTDTGQPGADLSDIVTFSQERGNLGDPSLEYDYTQEVNYVYAAGRSGGTTRNVQQVYDSTRYGISQWNRCEGFADARNQTADNGVREAGRAVLWEGRGKVRFQARLIDTEGMIFGKDWTFGDKVRAKYKNQEFDGIVRAVMLVMSDKGEEVKVKLEYES